MQACSARRCLAAAHTCALLAGPCQGRLWPAAQQPSSDAPATRARSGPDHVLLRAICGAELRAPLQAHHAAVVCQRRQQHPVVDVCQGVLARRGQHDGRPRHHLQDDHEGARAAPLPLLSDAFCVRAHVRAGSPVTAYARARPPAAVCCCACAPAGTRRCLAGSRAEARLPGLQGAGRLMNANIGDLWMPTICLLGLMASLGAAPTPRTVAPGAPPRAFCQAARHALCVWRAAACCAPASAPLSVCLPGWRRLGSLPMRCAAEAVYLPVSWHIAV